MDLPPEPARWQRRVPRSNWLVSCIPSPAALRQPHPFGKCCNLTRQRRVIGCGRYKVFTHNEHKSGGKAMIRSRCLTRTLALFVALCLAIGAVPAQNRKADKGAVQVDDLQKWLSYLASDELEGRGTFSEGLGLAAAYLAEQLRSWGVKPGGDNGSYFQRVRVLGVKSANHSTLTVEVNGQTRTFKNGEGITFPANVGGKRSLTVDQVEFLGYGLDAPLANHNDYAGKDVKGKAVVYLGGNGPKALGAEFRRALFGRARYATDQRQAVASIGVGGGGFRPGAANAANAPNAGGPGG